MLTLPIKKKWYDMILSGEKKEEYREIKPYYRSRLENAFLAPQFWDEPHEIRFRNGYRKDSPTLIALCTLSTGYGKTEWGAEPGKRYYILKIIEIEEAKTYEE